MELATAAEPGPKGERRATWWRWVVGGGLLVLLVWMVGPVELLRTLGRVSLPWALLTLAVAGVWLLIGGVNVWLLLRRLAPVPLRTFLSIYMVSWAATNVVPGQLGDVAQVVLLRRRGVPVSKSSAAYLVDKFVSLVWMLMVAAYGIGLYTRALSGWWLMALPALGVAGAFVALAVLRRLPAAEGGRVERVRSLVERLMEELLVLRRQPGVLAVNVSLTLVKWATVGLKYLCGFYAFGAALPFVATATIPVISSLVGYVPVTVGGLGTTEWTAAALFERAGADAATVVGVYLFLRAGLLLVAFLILLLTRADLLARAFRGGSRRQEAPP